MNFRFYSHNDASLPCKQLSTSKGLSSGSHININQNAPLPLYQQPSTIRIRYSSTSPGNLISRTRSDTEPLTQNVTSKAPLQPEARHRSQTALNSRILLHSYKSRSTTKDAPLPSKKFWFQNLVPSTRATNLIITRHTHTINQYPLALKTDNQIHNTNLPSPTSWQRGSTHRPDRTASPTHGKNLRNPAIQDSDNSRLQLVMSLHLRRSATSKTRNHPVPIRSAARYNLTSHKPSPYTMSNSHNLTICWRKKTAICVRV